MWLSNFVVDGKISRVNCVEEIVVNGAEGLPWGPKCTSQHCRGDRSIYDLEDIIFADNPPVVV